ncbi:hypothetical protein EPUS_08466 [Endocarpon pusillum Z07020]|uniref:O-methyltransferase C-terminal domain-containing protein n=1 Tax=Endocarpon pusillum (strain Z07020 / HMAS-L-300199) TaxID=1263415 RepID=U1GHL8_ENDPU|nr:uncharacterized protein EPUS_08466 [Endocarpon pusillum Z07020]ERF77162.1 hypothetical protein EPUS_08466 [Endocarpon pusillum Z07020]
MPSLTSMAKSLLARAQEIDAELEARGIPYPSFDVDTLEKLPFEAQKKRWELVDASHEFRQLTRGAMLSAWDIAFNWTDALTLRIIWRYKLASAVPLDGSASYEEIAATSGLYKPLVFRAIRAAIANNIFDEDDSGRVRHTAISRLLATHQGFYDGVGLQIEDLGPASTKVIEAWETLCSPYWRRPAPERARRFDSAMHFLTADESWNFRHMLNAFDWSTLDTPGARIVDIGGGNGQVSQLLAQHTKHLTFTVQDLPHVVAEAPGQLPDEFKSRILFEVQDFMTPQPAANPPTAFLVCRCTHNWSDKYSARLLANLTPALRKGSKVLIIEYVLDDKPVKSLGDKLGLQTDLVMATILNAQERYAWDFKRLLELSDERYVLEGIRKPEGSKLSLVEVSWKG